MKYHEWRNKQGQYLWYHADGSARVTLPLDYNWDAVYQSITADADIFYHDWEIPYDEHYFTSQMYAAVPHAWFKYKTMFEMFAGTLDGKTIDPDVFEAGFTRTTDHTLTNDNTYNDNDNVVDRQNGTAVQAPYTDTTDSKQRNINYNQGVQGATDINNGNIGELGNKYASNLADAIGNSSTDFGEQSVESTTNGTNTRTRKNTEDKDETFHETVHETRINYYDNLAFLRDRMDRLKQFSPFYDYFRPLFATVQAFVGSW